jgi:hypothetical protein
VSVDLKGFGGPGIEFLWSFPIDSNPSVLELLSESWVGGDTRAVYLAARARSAELTFV